MNMTSRSIITRISLTALIPFFSFSILAAQQENNSTSNNAASNVAIPAEKNAAPTSMVQSNSFMLPASTNSISVSSNSLSSTSSSASQTLTSASSINAQPVDLNDLPEAPGSANGTLAAIVPSSSHSLSAKPLLNTSSQLRPTNSSLSSNLSSPNKNNPSEKISVQFPHTSVMEVLALYEKLTGKRIIRDSNLAGPDLSIMITDPVSKKDAVSLLESSMLLNGYILIPVDEKTVKILGPSHPPRMEGLPLYQEESALPNNGEELVSFYQELHFLSPNEAINVLQGVIQVNPYGSLVAVPNTSAIIITDKTPVVRKALALLAIIDHEPSQIITEFVQLQRADASKIVDTLNQVFGKDSSSATPGASGSAPGKPPTQQAPGGQTGSVTAGNDDEHILSGKAQFIADKRTNRILLITRAENYRYVREMIAKLDQAVQFEEPLVRPLNYMSSSDIFPVLVDMLKAKDDDTSTNNAARTQPTPQSPMNNGSGAAGGTNSSGGANPADRLANNAQPQPPQSAIIGSTSLIGDPTANTIIVYGPPENKSKAAQIIDLLDKRPQQVYLAAVIGQMKLDNSTDFGSAYLFHYKGFNTLLGGGQLAGPVIAEGTTTAVSALGTAASGIGGLTAFGAIAGSLDVYANFLESTHKFRTIARPVVYTSNNRKATIFSGQSVPYNSSTQSSIVGPGSAGSTNPTTAFTQNVTYQDVTLKLEVIPLINSDNEVNLLISQQNKTVDQAGTAKAALTGIMAPVINTQELNTSVRIPSGSTIVLGGLIQEDKAEDQRGVPYLNKIPILGPLLGGHTDKAKTRSELIVMIQPIIVDSNFKMKEVSSKEGGTSDLGKRAEVFEKKLQPTPTPTPDKKKFHLFPLPKVDNF